MGRSTLCDMGIERKGGQSVLRDWVVVWDKHSTLQIALKSMGRSNLFLSLHLLVFIDLICILLLLFTPPPSSLSSYPHINLGSSTPSLYFLSPVVLLFVSSASLPILCPPPSFLLIWQAAIITQRAGEWTEFIFCSCLPLGLMNTVAASCVHGGLMRERRGGRGVFNS